MNRYMKLDEETIIVEFNKTEYYKIKIPREYRGLMGHDCFNCCIDESSIRYCDNLKIDDKSKYLCESLNKIGHKISNVLRIELLSLFKYHY